MFIIYITYINPYKYDTFSSTITTSKKKKNILINLTLSSNCYCKPSAE